MLKAANLFNRAAVLAAAFLIALPSGLQAGDAEFQKNSSGFMSDLYNRNVHDEFTNFLHLERLGRKITGKKLPAANVNGFDEVPDGNFFENRHARSRLSTAELRKGYSESEGPDLTGDLLITRGKAEGLHPGFFVKDVKGDEYILKFDPVDFMELVTSAEVIGSRFYYAIGYHVPQESILVFDSSKLTIDPAAKIVDETGFTKKFTQEKLDELILFLPQDENGRLRASASKILQDANGPFSFKGRRKEDPLGNIPHEERRSIRALQVFASWLNNYDQREGNSLDVLVRLENDSTTLRHYLIDFGSSLGAAHGGAKPPMFTHEHIVDYGQTAWAFFTLAIWEKPWQTRWREAGEEYKQPPAVGDFDNKGFDPGRFKTQLPHYAFKDLTLADAFWAAKIITSFSDEDIESMVAAGELTNADDAKTITDILKERRDIVGRYWFERSNPLDEFEIKGGSLTFKDLAVEKGYEKDGTVYSADVYARDGKHRKKIDSVESSSPEFNVSQWLEGHETVELEIRNRRPGAEKDSPWVRVTLQGGDVAGIWHQD